MTSAVIQPEKLLRQLGELWTELGAGKEEAEHEVLRACSMTLIALTPRSADAPEIMDALADLIPLYPCRLITVELTPGSERTLRAGVRAHCWKPFGSRRQICAEQVSITASAGAADDLPPVVRALLVPDLPVLLWCLEMELLDRPAGREVTALAGKVIVDSQGRPPEAALARIQKLRRAGCIAADLSWTRLTPWREALAEAWCSAAGPEPHIVDKITVAGAGERPGMEALYFAGWLSAAFPDAACVLTQAEAVAGAPGFAAVALEGPGLALSLLPTGEYTAEIHAGDSVRTVHVAGSGQTHPLREEFGIEGRDPTYERALERAAALAGAAQS